MKTSSIRSWLFQITILVIVLLVMPLSGWAAGPSLYVTNVGGSTITGFTATGSAVTVATGLSSPAGIAFDAANNLYVGNQNGYELDEISTSGNRLVLTTAPIRSRQLAFGPTGTLFLADEQGIQRFSGGMLTTVPTSLSDGFGLAVDALGSFYVTTASSGTITKIPSTGGSGTAFATGLNDPAGLAFDLSGNLYVATGANTIMEFPSTGGTGKVFASQGLNLPVGLAFDGSGNLYAANLGNGTIEKFDSSGNGSVFASGLGSPYFLAFGPQVVPESSAWVTVAVGSLAVLGLTRAGRRRA